MIWVILGGIAGLIVVGHFVADEWGGDFIDVLLAGGFFGLFFGTFVAAIICFGANAIMLPILGGNNAHHATTYRLQAIAARSDLHGQFFLGSGQVDSDPAYRFYRITDSGGFILDSADANITTVYQDDTTPRVIKHWADPARPWWSFFNTGGTTYEIHVPKGSVTATTNLDLP